MTRIRGLCVRSRVVGQPSILFRWPIRQRRVRALYRLDGAPATAAPTTDGVAHEGRDLLDGLILTPAAVLEGEPLQTVTRLAATNHAGQVLAAISKTALVLRDAAISDPRGVGRPPSASISLQALFQNGYDTLIALLQALPLCSSAYGPAATIPESCVTLFHVHNLLLQAAYASQQEFELWTELMQGGVELYLRKAPGHIVAFSNAHFEQLLDAMAHQDLWRFQRLLWQRMLPSIHTWDSMHDLCSVVDGCEKAAQAAATAAAAAAAPAAGASLASSGSMASLGGPSETSFEDLPPGWSMHVGASHTGDADDNSDTGPPRAGSPPAGKQSDVLASFALSSLSSPAQIPSSLGVSSSFQQQHDQNHAENGHTRTSTAAAIAASLLYDKQAELAEYNSLMSECIRAALEGAALRALSCAQRPHAAAQELLEVATAFDTRQRSPSALTALRYSFIPSSEWLSRVATAGVKAGERLSAAQVVKLLQDLDALAPKPVDTHGAPSRWLNAAGQAAVERAVLRHTASRVWSPQQAVSVIKALIGKCDGPPGDQLCGLVEGLLLACVEAKQDMGLLCNILQEAVVFASSNSGGASGTSTAAAAVGLTPAHMSLVRVALNRAIYLVGSSAPTNDSRVSSSAAASTSGLGRTAAGAQVWHNREFMFERYPRLLQAARRFGYPLQAFRLEEYAEELYNHLATAPGHELVAVGPEGLALVLDAVASTPCCQDPNWVAAFERACLTLVAVQFSVGYTHPKRWLGLLEATVSALPFPMPDLAAAIKALVVRLCDTRRHAKYFWHVLPLVGTLERRAAAATVGGSFRSHSAATSQGRQGSLQGALPPLWTSISGAAASKQASITTSAGTAHRRGPYASARRGVAGAAAGVWSGSGGGAGAVGSLGGSHGSGLRPVVPPPDMSKYHVSDEEYSRWAEDLGKRLALSMASLSDQDRVVQLSVLGIGAAGL